MPFIKPKNFIIKKGKFQLIKNQGNKTSREFNIKTNENVKLTKTSSVVAEKGIFHGNYYHIGNKASIKKGKAKKLHQRIIRILKKIKSKNKNILVIGPGKGYEVKNIKENASDAKIDTFDITDAIAKENKELINNKIIFKKGLENYSNEKMIGKYDLITDIYASVYHSADKNRSLIKIMTMLKPKGVAVIKSENLSYIEEFNSIKKVVKKLKLDEFYKIYLDKNYKSIIIRRN